ncbi:MAG: hypothetical protein R3C11_28435 [Planctomycetaceae bacterium]
MKTKPTRLVGRSQSAVLGGKGEAFATHVLYQKLAPGFKRIMSNTADSPLMKVFENFGNAGTGQYIAWFTSQTEYTIHT